MIRGTMTKVLRWCALLVLLAPIALTEQPGWEERYESGPIRVVVTLDRTRNTVVQPVTMTLRVDVRPGFMLDPVDVETRIGDLTVLDQTIHGPTLTDDGWRRTTERWVLESPLPGPQRIDPIRFSVRPIEQEGPEHRLETNSIKYETASMLNEDELLENPFQADDPTTLWRPPPEWPMPWWKSSEYVVIIGIAGGLGLLGAFLGFSLLSSKRSGGALKYAKREFRDIEAELDRLRVRAQEHQSPEALVHEAELLLRRSFEQAVGTKARACSPEEIRSGLGWCGVSDCMSERVQQCLERGEHARYGGIELGPEDAEAALVAVSEVHREIRAHVLGTLARAEGAPT